jgi:hypothetical protein
MAKIMVSIRDETFALLNLEALDRGITIQELLRAVIVPEWMRVSNVDAVRREKTQLRPAATGGRDSEIPPLANRSWSAKELAGQDRGGSYQR